MSNIVLTNARFPPILSQLTTVCMSMFVVEQNSSTQSTNLINIVKQSCFTEMKLKRFFISTSFLKKNSASCIYFPFSKYWMMEVLKMTVGYIIIH